MRTNYSPTGTLGDEEAIENEFLHTNRNAW